MDWTSCSCANQPRYAKPPDNNSLADPDLAGYDVECRLAGPLNSQPLGCLENPNPISLEGSE